MALEFDKVEANLNEMIFRVPTYLHEYHGALVLLQEFISYCNMIETKILFALEREPKDSLMRKKLEGFLKIVENKYDYLIVCKQNMNTLMKKPEIFSGDGKTNNQPPPPEVVPNFLVPSFQKKEFEEQTSVDIPKEMEENLDNIAFES